MDAHMHKQALCNATAADARQSPVEEQLLSMGYQCARSCICMCPYLSKYFKCIQVAGVPMHVNICEHMGMCPLSVTDTHSC
jgi:hypothetical protein